MALSQSALRAPSIPIDVAQRATPELEGLVGIGITMQASPGQTIVLEGDPCSHCFRVLTGAVRLYKGTADGRRQLIDFLVAGRLLRAARRSLHLQRRGDHAHHPEQDAPRHPGGGRARSSLRWPTA